MPRKIDPIWDKLNDEDWRALAREWLAQHGGPPYHEKQGWPKLVAGGQLSLPNVSQAVVCMNFCASPEAQWSFLISALEFASSDIEIGHIAAGPLEHLLGKHGQQFISEIESLCSKEPKFATAIRKVYRYTMSDQVWDRVLVLKSKYSGASSEES